jgi:hypothetical protein
MKTLLLLTRFFATDLMLLFWHTGKHITAILILKPCESLDIEHKRYVLFRQTGSGKTYSMGTSFDNGIQKEQQGIVPRFISDLFRQMEAQKLESPEFQYQISVSFLELYNEDLIDLLSRQPNSRRRSTQGIPVSDTIEVSIREDVFGNIYWSGVREEPCSDPEELLR